MEYVALSLFRNDFEVEYVAAKKFKAMSVRSAIETSDFPLKTPEMVPQSKPVDNQLR